MPYAQSSGALAAYLEEWRVSIVVLNGRASGTEYHLGQHRLLIGRGPGVDLALEAKGLAREHAVIEFWGDSYVLRDLDTQYGLRLNGNSVHAAELRDGDRFELGELSFKFALHSRKLQN